MVDVNNFRDEDLRQKLYQSEKSRYRDPNVVDKVVELDNKWREAQHKVQEQKTEINKLQKEYGKLFGLLKKEQDETKQSDIKSKQEDLQKTMATLKESVASIEEESTQLLVLRDSTISTIGNVVHSSVPVSNDEANNEIVREWGKPRMDVSTDDKFHHSEVMLRLGMYNPTVGSAVSGHRGYYLTGAGVLLNQALIRYGMDFLQERSYSLLQTPFFMTKESMAKTAQLSEFDDLLYEVSDDKYLIATSEQPISCLHQDEWIHKKALPMMYAGISTCFRKEAGASGKDVRGLFRVHQFEKVEQFCITSPEESWDMHEKMAKISEEFLKSLGIPYRVVNIVSGELNDAAAKKYDIEGWFPNTRQYRELVSCSNCTDYQARKLLIRFGSKEKGKKAEFVHMLNSTLCATERLMCCIAENYQTETGMVIPEVLRKYIYGQPEEFEFK